MGKAVPLTPVEIREDRAVLELAGREVTFPLQRLPQPYREWFVNCRRRVYDGLAAGRVDTDAVAAHLPTLVTWDGEGPFPCNLTTKGVGQLVRAPYLERAIRKLGAALEAVAAQGWAASLPARLAAAREVFLQAGWLEDRALTGLEIFAGKTLANLRRRPLASLLFRSGRRPYVSFQLDCVVEILGPEDRRFRFIELARRLFERDPFHLPQPDFACAYVFWITAVRSKTPFSREEEQ